MWVELYLNRCNLRLIPPLQQRMALDEQEDVREHLEEVAEASGQYLDDRKQQVSYCVCLSLWPRLTWLTSSYTRISSSSCNPNQDMSLLSVG